MEKPTIKIKSAAKFGSCLMGVVDLHPVLGDGPRTIKTSKIIKELDDSTFETLNSIYVVESWA